MSYTINRVVAGAGTDKQLSNALAFQSNTKAKIAQMTKTRQVRFRAVSSASAACLASILFEHGFNDPMRHPTSHNFRR